MTLRDLDRRGRCNVLNLTKPNDESIPVRFLHLIYYLHKKERLSLFSTKAGKTVSVLWK